MAKIIVNTTPSAITKIPSVASVPLETLAEVRIHAGGSTAKIGEPLAKKAPHTVYASDQNRYENADNKHIRISHMYSLNETQLGCADHLMNQAIINTTTRAMHNKLPVTSPGIPTAAVLTQAATPSTTHRSSITSIIRASRYACRRMSIYIKSSRSLLNSQSRR